jgi:hypothetical protein
MGSARQGGSMGLPLTQNLWIRWPRGHGSSSLPSRTRCGHMTRLLPVEDHMVIDLINWKGDPA